MKIHIQAEIIRSNPEIKTDYEGQLNLFQIDGKKHSEFRFTVRHMPDGNYTKLFVMKGGKVAFEFNGNFKDPTTLKKYGEPQQLFLTLAGTAIIKGVQLIQDDFKHFLENLKELRKTFTIELQDEKTAIFFQITLEDKRTQDIMSYIFSL